MDPRPWQWRYWSRSIKLIPALLSGIISSFLPLSLVLRVVIGAALYIFLFCITWRKADGTKAFPPYLW